MTEELKPDLMKKFKELNVAEYTTKYGDYYGLMFAGADIATKELQEKIKDLEWQLKQVIEDNDYYQEKNADLEKQIEKMKCCENCVHHYIAMDDTTSCKLLDRLASSKPCDKWEIKEND